jgi:hypothetical protein
MTIQALGDIGSLVSGLAAAVLAIAAIIGGGAGLGDWRAKQLPSAMLRRRRRPTFVSTACASITGGRPTALTATGSRS